MMVEHAKAAIRDLPTKPAKSVRKEDLGKIPKWFEKRMDLTPFQADLCARFCVRWSIGPPTLEKLLKEVLNR